MKKYLCTNDICYRSMIMSYFGVDKSRCDIAPVLRRVSEQKELYAFHITSIISNAEHIFTHQDIQFFVPVKFSACHARNILRVFTETFGDTVSDSESDDDLDECISV